MKQKTGKNNNATNRADDYVPEDYDGVLAFIQAVTVKSTQVISAPLSIWAEKSARV